MTDSSPVQSTHATEGVALGLKLAEALRATIASAPYPKGTASNAASHNATVLIALHELLIEHLAPCAPGYVIEFLGSIDQQVAKFQQIANPEEEPRQ